MSASAHLFTEIARTVAGGETSYARLRAGNPLVVDRASGARIVDADGRTYIDYCGGYGVNLFGHAPAFVLEAIGSAVRDLGLHIAFPHRGYGVVAELLAALVPGVEQVRFANSGTEATQAAIRLVRAATGRDLILKFEGHYHGWADHLCTGWAPDSAARPGRPDSPGIPEGSLQAVWVVPWNDDDALKAAVEAAGDRLAGAICEPVLGSGGLVEPRPGFLTTLCSTVREAGGLVILDEVMTGLRLGTGGAAARYAVTADVTTLGKVLGGGTALGAFGGSAEVMRLEAENIVVHGGTYTGSPITLAAAAAVLHRLSDEPTVYTDLEDASAALATGLEAAFADAGEQAHVRRVGSMLQPFFSARPEVQPRDVGEATRLQDAGRYRAFCDALEARGVHSHRHPLSRWFVSTAHGEPEITDTLIAAREALTDMVWRMAPDSGV
jgi:glutamate-1-semialdehyde 2,1-aminomutase